MRGQILHKLASINIVQGELSELERETILDAAKADNLTNTELIRETIFIKAGLSDAGLQECFGEAAAEQVNW